MFNLFRTRRGKLTEKIEYELGKDNPNIDLILKHIDEYEKANLETIKKLKREKSIESKKISGALKQTINVHGPITKELIGSATKRVYGSLLTNETRLEKFIKWIKNLL